MATKKRDYDFLFKLVVIGDSGVGKSCLLLRFADDTFSENYISTIGVDFRFRTVHIDKKAVKLQIWDTAGQDRFRTVNPAFYRGANGIVLVYDVTNKDSFDRIEGWMQEAVQYAQEPRALLVGNKADLEPRQVTEQMGAELAAKLGNIPFLETSAKNSTNVESAFLTIAQELVKSGGGKPQQGGAGGQTVKPVDGAAGAEKKDDCPCS